MRIWLFIALAACSSKKQPPPAPAPVATRDAAPAVPRPTMKPSPPIDLPDAGITALRLSPAADVASGKASEKGVFHVTWRDATLHGAAVVCRIESYNLAYVADTAPDGGLAEREQAVLYRPDPFVLDPSSCEVRFVDAGHDVVARACYRDGTMSAGPCPPDTFPPPKLPAGMAIDMQGASVHRHGDDLQVKAMFTLGQPLADKASFAIRCDGIASESSSGVVPLSRLAAGETLYMPALVFVMTKPLAADPTHCELRVTSKTTTLGTFCIADGSTEPGACGT